MIAFIHHIPCKLKYYLTFIVKLKHTGKDKDWGFSHNIAKADNFNDMNSSFRYRYYG